MSNTKLNRLQNEDRKAMKAVLLEQGGQIFSYPVQGATVVVLPAFRGSRMARVSVSYTSPNERKFRRKVGEFHALTHMEIGESVQVPGAFDPQAVADQFAYQFANL